MEVLQILKYHLKKECLDFVTYWLTPVTDLAPDNEDDDVDEVHATIQVNTQVAVAT